MLIRTICPLHKCLLREVDHTTYDGYVKNKKFIERSYQEIHYWCDPCIDAWLRKENSYIEFVPPQQNYKWFNDPYLLAHEGFAVPNKMVGIDGLNSYGIYYFKNNLVRILYYGLDAQEEQNNSLFIDSKYVPIKEGRIHIRYPNNVPTLLNIPKLIGAMKWPTLWPDIDSAFKKNCW